MHTQRILIITGILITGLLQTSTLVAAEKSQVLIITGNGNEITSDSHGMRSRHFNRPNWHHDLFAEELADIIDDIAEVTITEDLSVLNTKSLKRYDLILNHSLFLRPTQEQLDSFYQFVKNGKAYLTVHGGLSSFRNMKHYEQRVGALHISGKGPKQIEVRTFDAWWGYDYTNQTPHPMLRGVNNFSTKDELYMVQHNTTDVEVIARAEGHPVMWSRKWGNGEAIFLTLGHDSEAIKNAGFQTLLKNAVLWLTGYPILGSIPNGQFLINAKPVQNYIDLDDISSQTKSGSLKYSIKHNSNPNLVTVSIDKNNRIGLNFISGQKGIAILQVQAQDNNGLSVTTEFTLSVIEKGSGNLSLNYGASTFASSSSMEKYTSDQNLTTDGNSVTRWTSDYIDDSWIYVDLGENFLVNQANLFWEKAYGLRYDIQVSTDAKQWTTVFEENNGNGNADEINFKPTKARYVRMLGRERATPWGYSLYEFEIYGDIAD